MIVRITKPEQLALYRAEFDAAIEDILRNQESVRQTAGDIYRELEEHLTHPAKGIWCVVEDGRLLSWAAAKIYWDEDRKTCAVTWAWASPSGRSWSARVLSGIEAWSQEWGCAAIFCFRQTRLAAFQRLMRPYGWRPTGVVFGKDFAKVKDAHGGEVLEVCDPGESRPVLAVDGGEKEERVRATLGPGGDAVRPSDLVADPPGPDPTGTVRSAPLRQPAVREPASSLARNHG